MISIKVKIVIDFDRKGGFGQEGHTGAQDMVNVICPDVNRACMRQRKTALDGAKQPKLLQCRGETEHDTETKGQRTFNH